MYEKLSDSKKKIIYFILYIFEDVYIIYFEDI